MKRFLKRKFLLLPLPAWLAIVVLLVVGGLVGAYVFAQVTSESEVVEPLEITYIEHFEARMWPCYSSFLTFGVENEAPVPYGLRLTPGDCTFPENVHFGEVLVDGNPYTWGHTADMPANSTVECSIEVVAECDAAEGPVSVTINVERVKPGAPPPSPTPPTPTPEVPEIGFSPSSFDFEAEEGGADPESRTLSIRNAGAGTLDWSVGDDAGWLDLAPTSGSSTGETDDVEVSVDIGGMIASEYDATITISAPGATNTPVDVPVSLTITSPEAVTYDLTVTSVGCCPVDVKFGEVLVDTVPPGGSKPFEDIPCDTEVSLDAVAGECCEFDGWTVDGSAVAGNPITVTMDSDHTAVATCSVPTYTLTTIAEPAEGGTVTGGGTYDCCDTAMVEAIPEEGWQFTGWSGDLSGIENPTTVHMDGDKTVTATFVPWVLTWAVGDTWVFDSKYYYPVGTLYEDDTETIVMDEITSAGTYPTVYGKSGETFTLTEDCYRLNVAFVNDAGGPVERNTELEWVTLDPLNPPLTWSDQDTLDEVYREASVSTATYALATLFDFDYYDTGSPYPSAPTDEHGWPYDVGKEWGVYTEVKAYIMPYGALLTTITDWSIYEVESEVVITVPAGTFTCKHVVVWESNAVWMKGAVSSESWQNDDPAKFRVKYIDRATYIGELVDELESYSVAP